MQNVNDFFYSGVLPCVLFSAVMCISMMVSWLLMFWWSVCVVGTRTRTHTHIHKIPATK